MNEQEGGRSPFELSDRAIVVILSALQSRKAAEQNNLGLGPGSELAIHQVERTEVEFLQQMPDAAKLRLGIGR